MGLTGVSAMADLETQLRSLAERDDLFPATPDIVSRLDLAGEARAGSRTAWRLVAVVTLVVFIALLAALAIPSSRSAIADFFGIEGIRIEFQADETPVVTGTPTSIGGELLLGQETTLAAAGSAAPFRVTMPADTEAAEPDEVYLNQRPGATVVGMVWHATVTLPEIGDTGVGMLLLEIAAEPGDEFAVKKIVGGGDFAMAEVDGSLGVWIENGVLVVEPVQGMMDALLGPESRRSGNVLIWSDGEVTYRLETALPREDAVRIAESLAPVTPGGND